MGARDGVRVIVIVIVVSSRDDFRVGGEVWPADEAAGIPEQFVPAPTIVF